MTLQVRTAPEWADLKCKHIGPEGCWSQDLVAEQLPAFEGWQVRFDAKGKNPMLARRYTFSNFEGVKLALNAVIELADTQDHHPDASFGYNYLELAWATHSAGGLSDNDWICAARADQALKFLG